MSGHFAQLGWYAHQRREILGAVDGLRYRIAASHGGWKQEIEGMVTDTLYTQQYLFDMGLHTSAHHALDDNQAQWRTRKLVDLLVHQASNRCFSKCIDEMPPNSYAGLMADCPLGNARAIGEVIADSKLLWKLENAQHNDAIRDLLDDVTWLCSETFFMFSDAFWQKFKKG